MSSDIPSTAAAEKQTARVERQEIRQAAGHIKEASGHIAQSTDRTMFAAERTYAPGSAPGWRPWSAASPPKAVLKGVLPALGIKLAGSVLVLFSAFCFGAAIWRQLFKTSRRPMPSAFPA